MTSTSAHAAQAASRRDAQRYLTTEEVADIIRSRAETLRYWRQRREGPKWFRVGRRVLYAADDVEAWLNAARQGAA